LPRDLSVTVTIAAVVLIGAAILSTGALLAAWSMPGWDMPMHGGNMPGMMMGRGSTAAPLPAEVSGSGGETDSEVVIEAGDFFFRPAEFTVRRGEPVRLVLENAGRAQHDLVVIGLPIRDAGGRTRNGFSLAVAAPGQTVSAVITPLESGRFEFFCSVAGHRQLGMVGTLEVTD